MIHIAICDDEPKALENSRRLLNLYIEENPEYEVKILSFSAPLELLAHVAKHGGFDVLLLDVYMQSIQGVEVAREVRRHGDGAEIIFLTSSRNHALDAFEVDAAQYLVKPFAEKTFFDALDKVFQRICAKGREIFTLKTSEGIVRLSSKDVIFTETGRNNYQIIHTLQGKSMEVRMTAAELFELLSQSKCFVRCGASISVNLKYIRQISKEAIHFDTGDTLAYPYRAYQKLKEEFLRYQMSETD